MMIRQDNFKIEIKRTEAEVDEFRHHILCFGTTEYKKTNAICHSCYFFKECGEVKVKKHKRKVKI
jgi:hypothetical protein